MTCRPSSVAGAFCDEPEVCSGAPGSTCPPNDAPAKINVVCRPGSGDLCDPDERCTGLTGQGCPPDIVANPTTVCRAGSGDSCDQPETCSGHAIWPSRSSSAVATVAAQGTKEAAPAAHLSSGVYAWESLPVEKTPNGERRAIFDGTTATVDRLETHITTLKQGLASHAAHRHPDEELIFVREGLIEATINGAKSFLEMPSFSDFAWAYVDGTPIKNLTGEVPASTPLSEQISKDLKKLGFKFCGPTIVYAWMQAVGLVNDHSPTCFRYHEV